MSCDLNKLLTLYNFSLNFFIVQGKKKDKKQKRKSKQEGSDQPSAKPKKKSSKSDWLSTTGGGTTVKQLEVILLSTFQPYDTDGSGYLQPSDFWEVKENFNVCCY